MGVFVVVVCGIVCVLFCLYKIYKEFKPNWHYHSYGVYALKVNDRLIYKNATCWCGHTIPVYSAIVRGIPVTWFNVNRVLSFSPELVALAEELYYGERKLHSLP